ncbi:hypothetical protein [Embleya sp. NBC_00896]|uniref:hypothetical protein n=1 Tax=Embleya sp. NBC_00896 TaxID=2975961 RepID=UPI00386C15F7|nr:hypothetical protein OG928_08020 [Embleya sp. NBC_00896]
MAGQRRIGVGMVGHGFMGRAHTHAWHTVARHFGVPLLPDFTAGLQGRLALDAALPSTGHGTRQDVPEAGESTRTFERSTI